jgi:hypothetical protein
MATAPHRLTRAKRERRRRGITETNRIFTPAMERTCAYISQMYRDAVGTGVRAGLARGRVEVASRMVSPTETPQMGSIIVGESDDLRTLASSRAQALSRSTCGAMPGGWAQWRGWRNRWRLRAGSGSERTAATDPGHAPRTGRPMMEGSLYPPFEPVPRACPRCGTFGLLRMGRCADCRDLQLWGAENRAWCAVIHRGGLLHDAATCPSMPGVGRLSSPRSRP